jgi:hypothetical protein
LPFRASSRHLPSVALRECGVVVFVGDEGASLEMDDSGVPPGLGPGCFKNRVMQQQGGSHETKQTKNCVSHASQRLSKLPNAPLYNH